MGLCNSAYTGKGEAINNNRGKPHPSLMIDAVIKPPFAFGGLNILSTMSGMGHYHGSQK
jgi:hypothetical protein